jgi:ATP-dependent helicase HrpB
MHLPVHSILPDLRQALSGNRCAVLQAPPGSGKTTAVPLALLDENWLRGRRILLLEPRRLAARSAAGYMARQLGQDVGGTVGYRVRLDSRVGSETRIEVVTEGVLARRLQRDPELSDVGLVIFDEFHERHLESDLGLALCLDLQGVLNPDLRLLVMSATLETEPISRLMGDAPVIRCSETLFDVETRYLSGTRYPVPEASLPAIIHRIVENEPGDVLVFLPGAPEIRRVQAGLSKLGLPPAWDLVPLLGYLSLDAQSRAILPSPPGRRKIVLSTNIAETSLTIQGVRVVVDSGLTRSPAFDPGIGMTRLVTNPVSRFQADQRRGRAGRTSTGLCIRLWPEASHAQLPERSAPEMLHADLAGLVMDLSAWGVVDPTVLCWLDPPPPAALTEASRLLNRLDAIDPDHHITPHGRKMVAIPLHPRLSHMVMQAMAAGWGKTACLLAAVLGERDFIRFSPGRSDADLELRLDALSDLEAGRAVRVPDGVIDRFIAGRCLAEAVRLCRRLGIRRDEKVVGSEAGRLLAWAYPDRIGAVRPGMTGRFLLSNGLGACLPDTQPLGTAEMIVAAELDGVRQNARIYAAAGYGRDILMEQFAKRLETSTVTVWDSRRQEVASERRLMYGSLVLQVDPAGRLDGEDVLGALVGGIRKEGIRVLPWTDTSRDWQRRVMWIRRIRPDLESWPDVSDESLADSLETWLAPFLVGISAIRNITEPRFRQALSAMLTPRQSTRLEELAPTHLRLPSGARIRLDYRGDVPVLAARVQALFGCRDTPVIAAGRQKVLVSLLSPAGRPVQVTQDLAGFWSGSYREVRKQMKGRYPKHSWPEDPHGTGISK